MVMTTIEYQGDLHCEAKHGPSGSTIETDAPLDNQGKGEAFSPTDLLAAALGTCMLTVMGIAARGRGHDLSGASATVEKGMTAAPARRIGKLAVRIHIPVDPGEKGREVLERAALTCPVHKSLHPDIAMPIRFIWG
jgi:putative redox protein